MLVEMSQAEGRRSQREIGGMELGEAKVLEQDDVRRIQRHQHVMPPVQGHHLARVLGTQRVDARERRIKPDRIRLRVKAGNGECR